MNDESIDEALFYCLWFRCDFLSAFQQLIVSFDGLFFKRKKHRLGISVVSTFDLEKTRLETHKCAFIHCNISSIVHFTIPISNHFVIDDSMNDFKYLFYFQMGQYIVTEPD
jgi:hypothetical protein